MIGGLRNGDWFCGGVAFAEGIDRRAITADQLTLAKGY